MNTITISPFKSSDLQTVIHLYIHKDHIVAIISIFFPNAKIYLFGLYAHGDFTRSSDIDIAIDNGTPISFVEKSTNRAYDSCVMKKIEKKTKKLRTYDEWLIVFPPTYIFYNIPEIFYIFCLCVLLFTCSILATKRKHPYYPNNSCRFMIHLR